VFRECGFLASKVDSVIDKVQGATSEYLFLKPNTIRNHKLLQTTRTLTSMLVGYMQSSARVGPESDSKLA